MLCLCLHIAFKLCHWCCVHITSEDESVDDYGSLVTTAQFSVGIKDTVAIVSYLCTH